MISLIPNTHTHTHTPLFFGLDLASLSSGPLQQHQAMRNMARQRQMRRNTPPAAEAAIMMMVGGVEVGLAEGRNMILHYQYVIGQCLDNSIIL